MDLDNPDRECTECGASNWRKIESRTPRDYGENSEVTRHLYACEECDADARAYEEGGYIQFSGALR